MNKQEKIEAASFSPTIERYFANHLKGMGRLEELADDLLVKYENHESQLDQALRKSSQVLDILDATAASVAGLQGYVFGGFGLSRLWPYIFCPILSLAMGSYGLSPSLGRNLWLIGLGKFKRC
jgi:hypothetical protein